MIRKAIIKFGSTSVEVIAHTGTRVSVTTLNPKGSWFRVYDTSKAINQTDVTGQTCRVVTSWDGDVLCSKLEGSPFGTCESWRYVRGNTLVVKTSVKPREGPEAVCYWWYERMEVLQQQLGPTRTALLRHIAADQKRVRHATKGDTEFMRSILLDWTRWESPADEFIILQRGRKMVSSRARRQSRARRPSPSASSACSPLTMSASPSNNALNTIPSGEKPMDGDSVSEQEKKKDISISGKGIEPRNYSAASTSMDSSVAAQKSSDITFPVLKHNLPAHPVKRAASPGIETSSKSALSRRFGSADNLSESSIPQRPLHYRSPSSDSTANAFASVVKKTAGHEVPSAAEALMVLKLHEFVEDYGITSVIPVANPHDTSEPQLLGMSPEQVRIWILIFNFTYV